MHLIGGLTVVILSTLCWGGQLIAWLAPDAAVRWELLEAEADLEPVLGADFQAEARWDAVALWPMVVAGVLLISDHGAWPYFGLVGGGSYLYFAGRGITTRLTLRKRGFRIGTRRNVTIGLIALAVWATMAVGVVVSAVIALRAG